MRKEEPLLPARSYGSLPSGRHAASMRKSQKAIELQNQNVPNAEQIADNLFMHRGPHAAHKLRVGNRHAFREAAASVAASFQ